MTDKVSKINRTKKRNKMLFNVILNKEADVPAFKQFLKEIKVGHQNIGEIPQVKVLTVEQDLNTEQINSIKSHSSTEMLETAAYRYPSLKMKM